MDKFEYKIRSEEISKLIDEEKFVEAANIADMIDWRRVKSIAMLLKISALYRVNRRIEDSREILSLAYEKYPSNRSVLYSLCEVSIELDDVVAAIEYYKQFVKLAPRDNGVYTLRYRILEAQEASLEERIEILEELKKRDYQEEWGYELAYLYHRVGLSTKCVEECDDVILWFGDGAYVMKAMELKMLHTPLTAIQQKKYEEMKKGSLQESDELQDPDYTEEMYNEEGYAEQSYAEEMYNEEEYTEQNYAEQNYAEQNYAEEMYNEEGYAQQSYAEEMYNEEGYAEQNYAEEMYNEEGYAEQNYSQSGYDAQYDTYGQETYESFQDDFFVETNYSGEDYQEQYYQSFEEEQQVHKKMNSSEMDMSQYNTINLQKVVAESMKELFPDDDFSQSYEEQDLETTNGVVNNEVNDYTQIYKISELVKEAMSDNETLNQNTSLEIDALICEQDETIEKEQMLSEIVAGEKEEFISVESETIEEEQPLSEIVAEEIEKQSSEENEITHTGRVAQMAEGVLEEAPQPHTGAIKKVLVPGNDARFIKEESDIAELRDITEKKVMDEQKRMEAYDENVYQMERNISSSTKQNLNDTASQMDLENVLEEWERIKQVNVQKHQEEIRQNVLTQTGKLFADFDTLVNTGVLGELNNDISEINKLQEKKDGFLEADITSDIPQQDFDIYDHEKSQSEKYIEDYEDNEYSEYEEMVEAESEYYAEEGYEDNEYSEYEEMAEAESEYYAEEGYEDSEYSEYEEMAEAVSEYYTEEGYEDSEYSEYEEMAEAESEYYAEEGYEADEYITDGYQENESFESFDDYQEKYLSYNEMKEKADKYIDEEEAEMIAEMAKEDAMITQEIKMNTADLSSLSEKILATTRKETKGVKREEIREFSDEEQKLFENFAVTKKIKKQILNAMQQMTLSAYTGNVIITGEAGLDTVKMAKNLIRQYQLKDESFSGKVAKITGEKLNYKNFDEVFEKLSNGALIIEKANGLTAEKLYEMAALLNQENSGIIIIVEDTKKEINKMFEKQAMLADYFDIRIDLIEMDINALVAYAKNYANALEYSIDDLGVLALYTRISNMQTGNHVVTKDEVRDIIDEAIWKSKKSKIKNFVDVLLARRYDDEDMIVLKERDFI